MELIAKTPKVPYYAVIFTALKSENGEGYGEMSDKMNELAHQQDGFLGIESAKQDVGITVSYWRDLEAIKKWRENSMHGIAIKKGKTDFYDYFQVRIAKVERDYGFTK